MRRRDRIQVEATGLAESGHGRAQTDSGVEVFVADLLPGERARVVVDHVSPHAPVAWARIEERLGPVAPERVAPACPAFGRCGGCAWQHLDYPAQLHHKKRRVAEALGQLGLEAELEEVVAAPSQRGYRNKGKYVVGPGPILGAYEPRTHRVVDTAGCTAVAEPIDRAATAVREALGAQRLAVYDEERRRGLLRYAVIRAAEDGRLLIGLVTTSGAPREPLQAAAARLLALPSVSGVVWLANDLTTGVIIDSSREPELLGGAPTLTERIADVDIPVGITEFLQVNRAQATRMYAEVARSASSVPRPRVLDLYCGVGGISFALARAGAEVLGVESHPAAVRAARRAAERAGLSDAVRFREARARAVGEVAADFTPDAVVVDPPRKGLSPATRAALCELAAETLVYVSCEPSTLARDLVHLRREVGYRVRRLLPFDLMPGNAHIETVAVCRR